MKILERNIDGLWMLSQETDSSEDSSTDGILDLALQGSFGPSGLHNSKLRESEAKSALICYSIQLTANSMAISHHRFLLTLLFVHWMPLPFNPRLWVPHYHPYVTWRSSCSELGTSVFWTFLSPHTENSMRKKTTCDSSLGLSTKYHVWINSNCVNKLKPICTQACLKLEMIYWKENLKS